MNTSWIDKWMKIATIMGLCNLWFSRCLWFFLKLIFISLFLALILTEDKFLILCFCFMPVIYESVPEPLLISMFSLLMGRSTYLFLLSSVYRPPLQLRMSPIEIITSPQTCCGVGSSMLVNNITNTQSLKLVVSESSVPLSVDPTSVSFWYPGTQFLHIHIATILAKILTLLPWGNCSLPCTCMWRSLGNFKELPHLQTHLEEIDLGLSVVTNNGLSSICGWKLPRYMMDLWSDKSST